MQGLIPGPQYGGGWSGGHGGWSGGQGGWSTGGGNTPYGYGTSQWTTNQLGGQYPYARTFSEETTDVQQDNLSAQDLAYSQYTQ